MANSNLPFSLDDDFDELTDKDRTVELRGFICSVQAAAEVGSTIKYKLLKFGLSNGTQKVQCLIWGLPLIELHQPNIIINKIIHLAGAHCKASRLSHSLEGDGYCPFEIIIQASTFITFGGMHEPVNVSPEAPLPKEVTFQDINHAQGKIAINGFIRMNFTSIPSRFENASYGCGSITDGKFKITVHISNYVPTDFEKGAAVRVIGEVNNNSNTPLIITCKDMSCIQRREDVEAMSEVDLIHGSRTLKRRAPPA